MTRSHKDRTTGREAVYGWYPPQYDMYINPRNQRDYDKECLYQHSKSLYTDRRVVNSPKTPTPSRTPMSPLVKQVHRETIQARQNIRENSPSRASKTNRYATHQRSKTAPGYRSVSMATSSDKIPTPDLSVFRPYAPTPEIAAKSASPPYEITPDGKILVTKKQGWTTQATSVFTPPAEMAPTLRERTPEVYSPHVHFKSQMDFFSPTTPWLPHDPSKDYSVPVSYTAQEIKSPEIVDYVKRSTSPFESISGKFKFSPSRPPSHSSVNRPRIQSATIHRQKIESPKRPVRSAGTRRPVPFKSPEDEEIERICSGAEHSNAAPSPIQPEPSKALASVTLTAEAPPADLENAEELRGQTPDYEDLLDTYGWRAEVHGDPYGIKQVPSRLPYTVKCKTPEIPANPPRGHIQNYDTFFYNTIPRKPLSCVVHPEWVSELLLAKRMEHLKRTGEKYRTKNYAFIY